VQVHFSRFLITLACAICAAVIHFGARVFVVNILTQFRNQTLAGGFTFLELLNNNIHMVRAKVIINFTQAITVVTQIYHAGD